MQKAYRTYTASGHAVARAVMLCAIAVLSSGCGSLSFQLGELFGNPGSRNAPSSEIVTGSAPAARVPSSTLPPLPPAVPAPQASAPPAAFAPTAAAPQQNQPLGEEDRDIVRAALQQAMLDQDRAAMVPWLNQHSGTGGTITAVGSPVRQGQAVCRALLVTVQKGADTRTVQGNACRAPGYDWSLTDLRPFQAPA